MNDEQANGTVAAGRTIHAGGGGRGAPGKIYRPGETFTGPRDEIERLQRAGYLVDPLRPIFPHATQPGLSIIPQR